MRDNKVEIGDLLVGPGQVYRVLSISRNSHFPDDPYFVLAELSDGDEPGEKGMLLSEARDWNFMVYKPSEL